MHQRENPHLELGDFDSGVNAKRGCDHPGCADEGRFRAPRSRDRLRDYFWFCLDHVRAYNAAWNYFAEMSEDEIDRYRGEEASWHRPTWKMVGKAGRHGLGDIHMCDPLDVFASLDGANGRFTEPVRRDGRPLTAMDRSALTRLGLDERATRDDIKRAYKRLVKRYHPDTNGGDLAGEERFKSVAEAYRHLLAHWPDA